MEMAAQDNLMACPLCDYETDKEYAILIHMEEAHAEDQGSTVATATPDTFESHLTDTPHRNLGSSDYEHLVDCPLDDCLEQITESELTGHLELHAIEGEDDDNLSSYTSVNTDGPEAADNNVSIPNVASVPAAGGKIRGYQSPYSLREGGSQSSSKEDDQKHTRPAKKAENAIDAWKKLFTYKKSSGPGKKRGGTGAPPSRRRLGKAELGRYAYENQMPTDLVKLLEEEKYVNAEGIIYALSAVLQQSSTTEYAYLCSPVVQHISKLRKEGGFCGYRNIQMLTSYITGAKAAGEESFHGQIPSIFLIQDLIESAWDRGINVSGRVETGGIRGTRKFIGTPEAQALFLFLRIPCEAEGFRSPKAGVAEAKLFACVEKYLEDVPYEANGKVRCTQMPPIYFQHRGHSMTIVGLERRTSGALELIVFDPMFRAPPAMTQLAELLLNKANRPAVGETNSDSKIPGQIQGNGKGKGSKSMASLCKSAEAEMKLYRRGNSYLKKYTEFEVLKLAAYHH